MTLAARGITDKDYSKRLEADRKDELGELAATLNRAFDRVGDALDSERQVISDLSHELRMPLAIAQSETSQLLMKETADREYHAALETVSREISHLSAVTNRLLFLARSERGAGVIMAELDLQELVRGVAADAAVLCENKGIEFRFTAPEASNPPGSYVLGGDAVRLRELLLNLLDNAIRYTAPEGRISLVLGMREGQENGPDTAEAPRQAVIAVSDTGIGIAEKHLPHIFERFYRIDGKSEADGSGLGLAICKRIAELHGGRIEVSSKKGRGTTFTVYIPLKTMPVVSPAVATQVPPQSGEWTYAPAGAPVPFPHAT
jgi:signal transduction histidine kinase